MNCCPLSGPTWGIGGTWMIRQDPTNVGRDAAGPCGKKYIRGDETKCQTTESIVPFMNIPTKVLLFIYFFSFQFLCLLKQNNVSFYTSIKCQKKFLKDTETFLFSPSRIYFSLLSWFVIRRAVHQITKIYVCQVLLRELKKKNKHQLVSPSVLDNLDRILVQG